MSTQPLIQQPPDAADDRLTAALRLSLVPGIGPRTWASLIERFGEPRAVLSAAPSELREVPGIGAKLMHAIAAAHEIDAAGQLDLCRRNSVQIIVRDSPAYPPQLTLIPDPPPVLFVQGTLQPNDALAIAIVGSRHGTHYGVTQAERLAGSLARAGMTIISGLARGIDAAAHRGALAAGGRTLAVLGSGVLNIYPPEHDELAAQVRASGALLSEAPPQASPHSGAFPHRNRIISGLSLGVLVVEASARSGALITARHAMEQGREVYAVPGRIDSRTSQGCHRLIRDGAKLVETVDDILEELGPLANPAPDQAGQTVHHPAELQLNDLERQVLAAIDTQPISLDQVVAASRLPVPQVLATLSALEMRRLVRRVSGTLVARP